MNTFPCYFCNNECNNEIKGTYISEFNFYCQKCIINNVPYVITSTSFGTEAKKYAVFAHIYFEYKNINYHYRINILYKEANLFIIIINNELADYKSIYDFKHIPDITPDNILTKIKTILTFL